MSSASAVVKFSDGTIRWAVYHGTVDVLIPTLHDSASEAFAGRSWIADVRPAEDVEIYTDYGGGFWWTGQATRDQVRPESCQPFGAESLSGEVLIETAIIYDGRPEWVKA